jgi:site-specific recombinase XerD
VRLVQRKKTKLSVYRRHTADCPGKAQGRKYTKCNCPVWMNGTHHGEPIDQSLGTRSMQEALRQVAALEDPHTPFLKPVEEAIAAYQQHIALLAAATKRRYTGVLRQFMAYLERERVKHMADIDVSTLDGYRAARQLRPATLAKELSILNPFFTFALKRKWIEENPAQNIEVPRHIRAKEIVPYEESEITRMLAACDEIGQSRYERLRARAMLLLLRYTGLRISDVASLAKDRIQGGRIYLRTLKTGGLVFLKIPQELLDALAMLPAPRGAPSPSRYFFWNEAALKQTNVDKSRRTLVAVFKRSGVQNAHAHRFRHTLATEILARGDREEDVAKILGISPNVVRQHYAKWSPAWQARIDEVIERAHPKAFGLPEPEAQKRRVN